MTLKRPTTREFLAADQKEIEAVEEAFFGSVRLANKTFKTTRSHRLDDLNELCAPFLVALGPRTLRVMDVGVSSGISTLEWAAFMAARGIRAEILGTDKLIQSELVSFCPGFAVLLDDQRNILHLDILGFGWLPRATLIKEVYLWPLRFLTKAALRLFYNRSSKESIALISRRLNGSMKLVQDDMESPNREEYIQAFDVIRVANILNIGYFREDDLTRMINTLKQRLKLGGLLIVCRTLDTDKNHATVFRFQEKGLVPLGRLGQGSEIEQLITAVA